jgi:opacity protein-like surface antigen
MTHAYRIALLAALILPAGLAAQSRTSLAIAAGPSFPLGRLKDTETSGTGILLGLVRGWDESPIGLRLDLSYDRLKGKTVGSTRNGNRQIAAGTANLLFSMHGYSFKPYLLGGVGAFKMTAKPALPETKVKFGFDLGLGFTVPVGGRAIFLEGKVNSISQTNAKPVRYVPVVLGFLF